MPAGTVRKTGATAGGPSSKNGLPHFYRSTPKQFWARVRKTKGCWLWTGAVNSSGYGSATWLGKRVVAHRLAYFLSKGGIKLQTGFRVPGRAKKYRHFLLHTCDNKICCRPKHMELGTMRKNNRDAYKRGRNSGNLGCRWV